MNWFFCVMAMVAVAFPALISPHAAIVGAMCGFLAGGFFERAWKEAQPNRPGIER